NIHYYDARENYDFHILNSLDFAKKLNVKILKRKDVLNLELERDSLFESIFNCIEYVILTYKEDCSLSNNGFISDSLCSILKEYYF
ncbi:MAG: hypothetical protein IJH34_17905, partial [Romboutsia sp.]|nr:hypothetical protein [Romboutsia sp.]